LSFTNKFRQQTILCLQTVRVKNTVANLLKNTPYIIRSIMEDAVENALRCNGLITNFTNVSLDEKVYKPEQE
jgi:hypothetical protein